MDVLSKEKEPSFIVNVGDNFYWCGIQNTSDFQIKVDFEEPYAAPSLQLPWYSALGNHEYGYNVSAQIDYAKVNSKWIMDDRYYSKRLSVSKEGNILESDVATIDAAVNITLLFLDTSPCIAKYRSNSSSGWDPCSDYYPTCSLVDGDDDFEGECQFHTNILSQNCSAQKEWLVNTLSVISPLDWLIVVGHHPLDEVDVEDFTSFVSSYHPALYLNGHTHTLARYTIDYAGIYVTTGAGALVDTPDQLDGLTMMKSNGSPHDIVGTLHRLYTQNSHSYQTVFNKKVAGFTHHEFNEDFSALTTRFISYTGETIYSFTTDKTGQEV